MPNQLTFFTPNVTVPIQEPYYGDNPQWILAILAFSLTLIVALMIIYHCRHRLNINCQYRNALEARV